AQPCQGCFPFEPMQLLRHDIWHRLFFHSIEPSTVDHPDISFRFSIRIRWLCFEFRKTSIEPGKIISRADPQNPSKNMCPTKQEMDEFLEIAQKDVDINPAN